jgi:peptide/nickel transport system substrate-binding protein
MRSAPPAVKAGLPGGIARCRLAAGDRGENMMRAALTGMLLGLAVGLAPGAGAQTLRFAGTTPPLTFDPHSTNDFVTTSLVRQVYDSMVGLTPEMELAPSLATEWTYRGDSTWRFKLRDGVRFQDGTPMTAEDVAFSIMRQRAVPLYAALFGGIRTATAVDARTVDVATGSPDPILPRKMTRLFVMSRAWLEANGIPRAPDLGAQSGEPFSLRNANGTGPMRLTAHIPGQRAAFARNAQHWGPMPGNVQEAIYTPVASAPTRVAALLSGEVDLVTDLPNQDIGRVQSTAGFKVAQGPQQLIMELEMDGTRDVALDVFDKAGNPLQSNPFRDVRVRRAIQMSVNNELIAQRVLRGQARPIGIPSAPGFGGYQADLDKLFPQDVSRARALLAEAGYPDGFVTALNCPTDRYVASEEVCRAVAGMLARIGIEVRVRGMVWADFARMLVNGPNSSFHLIGGSGNSGDAQDTFVAMLATRDRARNRGGLNWAMWTNPEFDAVVDELVTSFDPARRTALYRRGFEIAREYVHAIYLHQPQLTWGMRSAVTIPVRADATVVLQNVVIAR